MYMQRTLQLVFYSSVKFNHWWKFHFPPAFSLLNCRFWKFVHTSFHAKFSFRQRYNAGLFVFVKLPQSIPPHSMGKIWMLRRFWCCGSRVLSESPFFSKLSPTLNRKNPAPCWRFFRDIFGSSPMNRRKMSVLCSSNLNKSFPMVTTPSHTGRVMRHVTRGDAKKWKLFHYLLLSVLCEHCAWQQLFPFVVLHHADVTLDLTRSVCTRGERTRELFFTRTPSIGVHPSWRVEWCYVCRPAYHAGIFLFMSWAASIPPHSMGNDISVWFCTVVTGFVQTSANLTRREKFVRIVAS